MTHILLQDTDYDCINAVREGIAKRTPVSILTTLGIVLMIRLRHGHAYKPDCCIRTETLCTNDCG
jgi:hypothetical protein